MSLDDRSSSVQWPEPSSSFSDFTQNDMGNVKRLKKSHGKNLLFVRDKGWHYWTGTHWTLDGGQDFAELAVQDTAEQILSEVSAIKNNGPRNGESILDFEARLKSRQKWAIASGNSVRLNGVLRVAQSQLSVSSDGFDTHDNLLNLSNGTLVVEASCEELLPHDRSHRLTRLVNIAFDPNSECPQFDKFLERIQPDPEVRLFLQRFCGYMLTGSTAEEKLLFLYGTGANGKTTFLNVLSKVMGNYASEIRVDTLLFSKNRSGSEASPDLAKLSGVRMVRVSEVEQGSRFSEATIKSLTGGEPVATRHLHKEFFTFRPTFKMLLAGNHMPDIRGQDRGIWRRVLMVPFGVSLPEDEIDRDLEAKLETELPGILNWLLDGLRVYLDQGLKVPSVVKNATEDYRAETDLFGSFFEAHIEVSPADAVTAKELNKCFAQFCMTIGQKVWSRKAVSQAMRQRGFGSRRAGEGVTVHDGIRLRNDHYHSDAVDNGDHEE